MTTARAPRGTHTDLVPNVESVGVACAAGATDNGGGPGSLFREGR